MNTDINIGKVIMEDTIPKAIKDMEEKYPNEPIILFISLSHPVYKSCIDYIDSHNDSYDNPLIGDNQTIFYTGGSRITLVTLNLDDLGDDIKIQAFIRAIPTKCRIESSDYIGLPADRERVEMSLDFSASMYHSPAITKAADEIKKTWNDNSNNE